MKKKIIAFILSAAAVLSCASALAAGYSDVSETAWYYDYVNRISELKAFSGYEDGTFRPENEITQEEFLKTVVCLVAGELTEDNMAETKSLWSDGWDAWAAPYLDKAFELGLITAEDTMFRYVGIPCSRAEMAKLITRAVDYMGEDAVKDTSTYVSKMKDYERIKEDYRPYVLQAYAKGIISGYEDGSFKPDGYLTRAEASSVLVRLVDKDARVTDTTSGSSSGGHSSAGEKTYDFYGRQVTWTEPLRTDVPEQYQISLADYDITQAEYLEWCDGNKEEQDLLWLTESKDLMFEDSVLKTITFENGTIKMTVPDYLPQGQKWNIMIDVAKDAQGEGVIIEEPGEYTFENYDYDGTAIRIRVSSVGGKGQECPQIDVRGKKYGAHHHTVDDTEINIGACEPMIWVQGFGVKDYFDYSPITMKYVFKAGIYELDW